MSDTQPTGWIDRLRRLLLGEWRVDALVEARLRRRIQRAPRHTPADAPEAVAVAVVGTVGALDGRLLEAPLTGRACVMYAIRIEEVRSMLESPVILDRLWEAIPFTLAGAEGDARAGAPASALSRAVIDPAHAQIAIPFAYVGESKAAFDADERQRALLVDRNLVHRNWFNTSGLRYHEAVIRPGDRVVVLGSGTREADPVQRPGMYRDTPTRMRFAGTPRHPLVLCPERA